MLGISEKALIAVALLLITWAQLTVCTNAFLIDATTRLCEGRHVGRITWTARPTTSLNLMNFLNEGKKAMVKKLAGDYDEVAVRKRMDGLIRENPVLMLSFETCPFCVKAREILDAKNAKYFDLDLTKDPEGKAIRAELANLVGRTSVPAIWIDSQFIGGCNDGPMGGIAKLNDEGKLDSMLKAVNAI